MAVIRLGHWLLLGITMFLLGLAALHHLSLHLSKPPCPRLLYGKFGWVGFISLLFFLLETGILESRSAEYAGHLPH